MKNNWKSILVGLVVPFSIMIGGILVLGPRDQTIWIYPLVDVLVFLCFPLFTLCLWLSWIFFDRKKYTIDINTKKSE